MTNDWVWCKHTGWTFLLTVVILFFPYSVIPVVCQSMVKAMGWVLSHVISIILAVVYYYARACRWWIISITPWAWDVSSEYCDPSLPNSQLEAIPFQIFLAYQRAKNLRSEQVDRHTPEYLSFCMENGWNAFGTFFWGHVLGVIIVFLSMLFANGTRVVMEIQYNERVDREQRIMMSRGHREDLGILCFWVVYPTCNWANYLVRRHYSDEWSKENACIVTVLMMVLLHRLMWFVYLYLSPRLLVFPPSSLYFSSSSSSSSTVEHHHKDDEEEVVVEVEKEPLLSA